MIFKSRAHALQEAAFITKKRSYLIEDEFISPAELELKRWVKMVKQYGTSIGNSRSRKYWTQLSEYLEAYRF